MAFARRILKASAYLALAAPCPAAGGWLDLSYRTGWTMGNKKGRGVVIFERAGGDLACFKSLYLERQVGIAHVLDSATVGRYSLIGRSARRKVGGNL